MFINNFIVSSIKYYYSKVVFLPDFNLEKVYRPKRGHYLPTILSIQEVDRMLRVLTNLKHVCLLYSIYNGGIRVGELVNIRLQDIHWDRNQVLVKGRKGKKDRMVMLSQTLKEVLRLYVDAYKPIYWLLEGQDKKTTILLLAYGMWFGRQQEELE